MVIDDLPTKYREYLARFTSQLGDVQVGAFAKFGGRLIKKLTFEEFKPAYIEYTEMSDRYYDSMIRGDTINDLVLRVIREKAASLILKPPA